MKKKIDYCKEQMEKGNEHIHQLEEKKSGYKKQLISLKAQTNTLIQNKDTIISKMDQQIQAKNNEITGKNSEIRELNIDKSALENKI